MRSAELTGAGESVQVRREGKANHYFHREPCGRTREGAVEASVAARVAGMIEHRKRYDPERRGFLIDRRQHLQSRHGEGLPGSALSEESQGRTYTLYRDSGGLQFASAVVPGRGRKEIIRIDDERIEAIGFSHSTCEVGEQRNICSGGADGGKDWNQGESAKPKHAPDTGSGTHVTSGGADTASSHEETEGEAHCSLHHITTDALGVAYFSLKKDAAAGVDGMTWHEYGNGLEERLLDLHDRVHSGRYRALPSRRVEIPKPDGGTRPLGIAALEDKIVQSAVAETILVPIFEPEFLGFSYGSDPGVVRTMRSMPRHSG